MNSTTRRRPSSLPGRRVLRLTDVHNILSAAIAEDAIRAGWLTPRCRKPNGKQTRLFALEDVHRVEERILNGEYPEK